MQSPILRPRLRWRCLLLIFLAIPVAATPDEGTILRNWLRNITAASNSLASWRTSFADPCAANADWYGVSCGGTTNVLSIDLRGVYLAGQLVPELGQLSHLTTLRLDGTEVIGPIPAEFGNLAALTNLSLSGNILYGSIAASLGNLTNLQYLSLDTNVLTGSVPKEIASLPVLSYLTVSGNRLTDLAVTYTDGLGRNLRNLDLSYNRFGGPYPESLASLPSLSTINLDSNLISGVLNVSRIFELLRTTGATHNITNITQSVSLMNNNISSVLTEIGSSQVTTRVAFKLVGNPYCARPSFFDDGLWRCLCQQDFVCYLPDYPVSHPPGPCLGSPYKSKKEIAGVSLPVVIGIICGIVFICAIVIGGIIRKFTRRKPSKLEEEYKQKFAELEVNPQPFLYKVLRAATLEFSESTKLGQGGFGTVYKGTLLNGTKVAIKKLEPKLAAQGDVDDFLNEVVSITKLKHPNLVNLKGYCIRGKQRMLVYEYVENTDVEQSLLLGQNKEAMTWSVRFDICLGVAHGLHYLHEIANPRVIHRDIKASNILLGAQYEPKIGDFGLALLFPDNETHLSLATIAGTKIPCPEYASFGQLSEKTVVYSFGVLCLEIVSGRKNIDQSKPTNQVYLASWQFPQRRPSMEDVENTMQGRKKLEPFPMNEMVNFESILGESTPPTSLSIEGHGGRSLHEDREKGHYHNTTTNQ